MVEHLICNQNILMTTPLLLGTCADHDTRCDNFCDNPAPAKTLCACGCGRSCGRRTWKYASNQCHADHRYRLYIHHWQAGLLPGINRHGRISCHVRRWILKRDGYRCVLCGWGQINPHTQTWALIVDHIDGDAENTTARNLRTLCPNCDSLTPTYKGANRGCGRRGRRMAH
jgi:hypothetical protein